MGVGTPNWWGIPISKNTPKPKKVGEKGFLGKRIERDFWNQNNDILNLKLAD